MAYRECEHVYPNGGKCRKKYAAKGLCFMHYMRKRRDIWMDKPPTRKEKHKKLYEKKLAKLTANRPNA